MITSDIESNLDKNAVVSLDLVKVHIIKDAELSTRMAKYISRTLSVNNLLVCLSNKFFFAIQNASLSYLKDSRLVEAKDKSQTMSQLEIQEGALINVSQSGEHNLMEPWQPVRPKPMPEIVVRYQEDESSKTDENNNSGVRDTVVRQVFDDSDYGDNHYTNPSREGSDKISTGIYQLIHA